jgi:hypothetical protein
MAIAKRAVSQPVSLPAPVGGWNARDALPSMAPSDAVILENWYPATTEVALRDGYEKHATGITGQVETLMAYSGAATDKLFAIAGGNVYDATSAGAVGAAVVTGLSNSRWGYCNIATAGGNFLSMANGVDAPRNYNGSTWTTPAITGVTATTLRDPILYAERQFFIQDNTLKVWYLPVDSIAGAANVVDVSSFMTKGGYIVAHGTWTIDAGQGVNDHYVIMTNKGQIIVYQGIDPSSATTWSMVGVWDIGSPVGRRSLYKYAGDMLIVCQDGVVPLSGALQSSRVQPRVAITDKIQFAISAAITDYGTNFGWQLMYVPGINQLWLNVPVQEGQNQQQYVMNTITGAWCNYTGWSSNCMEMFDDEPYFGGNGYVAHAWYSGADDGNNITALGLQAFNNFSSAGKLKRFTMSRPIFRTDGAPAIYAGINIDFNTSAPTTSLNFSPSSFAKWDSALWDASNWGGNLSVLQNWQGLNGVGYYGAPIVQTAASGIQVRWVSTDIVIEGGAIL